MFRSKSAHLQIEASTVPSWLTTLSNCTSWFNPFKGQHSSRQSVTALTSLFIAHSLQPVAAFCFKSSAGNPLELTCYGKESAEDLYQLFNKNCSAITDFSTRRPGHSCLGDVLWDINDPLKLFFPTEASFGQSTFSNPICIMKYFREHSDACINNILTMTLQNDQWLPKEVAYVALGAAAGLATFGILACCVGKKYVERKQAQITDLEANKDATERTPLTLTT